MRISDWSSDVCSSDLLFDRRVEPGAPFLDMTIEVRFDGERQRPLLAKRVEGGRRDEVAIEIAELAASRDPYVSRSQPLPRSEEHTSELQSLMRISYAVFCLTKKNITIHKNSILNNMT